MQIEYQLENKNLTLRFVGELDHHSAKESIKKVGGIVDEYLPLRCVIDFEKLSFMDSSGIAVVLGVYRRLYEIGGELLVINVPNQPMRVLAAAGIDKIVRVRKILQTI